MSYDDDTGYDLADPKHPTYADRMAEYADAERKRRREQGLDTTDLRVEAILGSGFRRAYGRDEVEETGRMCECDHDSTLHYGKDGEKECGEEGCPCKQFKAAA